ncbi:MAG: GMC family oxidoreductase N-terminal domain-containing protein [Polyangiaceae bacterium]
METYDFVIIGSGFGGSVSALRLAEKGYRVAVLEMGKRWKAEDFAESSWDLRKFLWKPGVGLHGILQMTLLRDVFFLHGAGVGGGSLVYANTLLQPPPEAFEDPQWVELDWKKELAPHYDTAKRMLGAVPSEVLVETDRLLKSVADDLGRGHTFHRATVGVYFGKPGERVADPFFGGEGPERAGCIRCGGCMVGCRHDAKNSLDKNYLYLAEKRGVAVFPETRVLDIRPLGEGGKDGYEITAERSTGFFHPRVVYRARGVVLSAGSFGTVDLLMRCREAGSLPALSPQVGAFVRTNSEALLAVTTKRKDVDYSKGIAISAGAFVDDKTHIEICRYPAGSDSMSLLATVLTDDGPGVPRWLRWIGNVLRKPWELARLLVPRRLGEAHGHPPRHAAGRQLPALRAPAALVLAVRQEDRHRACHRQAVPVYIPIAGEVAKRLAKKMDGVAQSGIVEVMMNRASTAHILGSVPHGSNARDRRGRHRKTPLRVRAILRGRRFHHSRQPGRESSLTITAMAERIMARVPAKEGGAAVPPAPSVAAPVEARRPPLRGVAGTARASTRADRASRHPARARRPKRCRSAWGATRIAPCLPQIAGAAACAPATRPARRMPRLRHRSRSRGFATPVYIHEVPMGHATSGSVTLRSSATPALEDAPHRALLYAAGAIKQKGSIDRGTTVTDYEPFERSSVARSTSRSVIAKPTARR